MTIYQETTTGAPGHQVLDEARAFLGRFAILPSDAALDALTLWCAHTHAVQAFNASPRLAVLSEHPASGKTRVLELASLLSHDPTMEVDVTGPALVALISQRHPTVFLDETDQIFGANGGESHRSLRAILNSGYKQGATVSRRSGGAYVQQSIFGAVGFGGLGILPRTLMSRSIVIRMAQRRPEQRIEPYFPKLHEPTGAAIGAALGSWASSVSLELAVSWPSLPDGIQDRAAEIWEPILAVADAAGGEWPDRARAACTELALDVAAEPVQAPGQQLLSDLRAIWGESGNLPTSAIVTRLFALPGTPWASLWPPASAPRELAALLAPYGVQPVKVRLGEKTAQGYRRLDMERAWHVPDVPEHEQRSGRELIAAGR
jgi:Protein of unknown function (DUF3631)